MGVGFGGRAGCSRWSVTGRTIRDPDAELGLRPGITLFPNRGRDCLGTGARRGVPKRALERALQLLPAFATLGDRKAEEFVLMDDRS